MHTPLFYAITRRQYEAFKLLVDSGANPNCQFNNQDDANAIFWMVYPVCVSSWDTPLYDHNYYKYIKYLVDRGEDINHTDNIGWTPLLLALDRGEPETAELLIKAGAPVNKRNKSRMTGLYLASRRGLTDIVKLLIEHGVDVNATIREGRTAIGIAKKNGHTGVVELLIKAGAVVT